MMAPSEGPASSATAAAPSGAATAGTAAATPAAPAALGQTPSSGAASIPLGSPAGIATPPAAAATPGLVTPATTPPVDLVTVQQSLTQLESQARQTSDDQRLAAMRTASASAQATADRLVAAHDRDLRRIDQELNHMGAAPRRGESDAVRRRRALLTTQRGELEGELKQAQTVDVAANKTYDFVAQRRRDAFSARVFTQTASPITPAFWSSLADATTSDFARFVSVADQAGDVAARAPEPRAVLALLGALLVAVLLLFPARRMLERVGRPKGRDPAARHGFPVTANAVWIALVDTLLPGLAATSLHIGAQWGGLLSDKANAFAQSGVVAVAWGAAVLALGRATVARDDPAARLVPVPDEAVRRIRAYLWTVALITGAGFLLTRINDLVGASVAATVAANCARAIAYAGVAGLLLVNFGRSRASAHEGEPEPDSASSSGWTLVSLALTGAIVVTLGAVFAGYTTLAVLVSGQIFWLSLIAALAYLLLRFADDLCGELFRSHGWAGAHALHPVQPAHDHDRPDRGPDLGRAAGRDPPGRAQPGPDPLRPERRSARGPFGGDRAHGSHRLGHHLAERRRRGLGLPRGRIGCGPLPARLGGASLPAGHRLGRGGAQLRQHGAELSRDRDHPALRARRGGP